MSRSRNATRLSRALLALAVGAALAVPAAALAQAPKYTLKFNHVLGPKEPYHAGFQNWAKRVEERTKGGLKIEVFHSAQLGKEEDIIEQIRQGANIGQNTDSARMGNYVPGHRSDERPVLRRDAGRGEPSCARRRPCRSGRTSSPASTASRWSASTGCRATATSSPTSRSKTPDDLKGQRIRTPPAPIWQESIRALGAAPVAMAFGEMYRACSRRRSTASSSSTTTSRAGASTRC